MQVADIERRLENIERRLSRLDGGAPTPRPAAAPTAPAPAPPPRPMATPVARPVVGEPEIKPGNLLAVVAILCFVLAAGFIIKLSIDSGWLTPERQIGLAALFGFGLIGAGFMLKRKDLEYASYLPGAGVIVLYLASFAAYRIHGLVPFEIALAMTALVSGICIWLYTEIEHDIYPLTAAIGSYASPILMNMNATAEFSLYYFVLCSVAFATISIWVESRLLAIVSSYAAIFATGLVALALNNDTMGAGMLALHFFIFTLGTFFYTQHTRKPLSEQEAYAFLPVLLIFYAFEYTFISRINSELAPWISLGFAGLVLGLYFATKNAMPKAALNSQGMIFAFASVVVFHSAYLELMPGDFRPWLVVVFVLALAGTAQGFESKKNDALLIPRLGLLAVLIIELFRIVSHVIMQDDSYWLLLSLCSAGSIWVLLLFGKRELAEEAGYGMLAAAHLLAVLGLFRLTDDIGSLAISASWLLYALAVIGVAFQRRDEVMAKSAVFVLSFAAAKALLFDVAAAAPVVRIFCLLLTGVVLYGSGFFLRKISGWKS